MTNTNMHTDLTQHSEASSQRKHQNTDIRTMTHKQDMDATNWDDKDTSNTTQQT